MQASSNVAFAPPLAHSRDYPSPVFSVRPTERLPVSGHRRIPPADVQATFQVSRARYALAMLALATLRPGDNVLLPSYHCPAMVQPFLWAGCKVSFYPMAPDLSPLPDPFQALIRRARAVVIPRYFGFEQVSRDQFDEARSSGCLIIEDLAHAAFASTLHGDVGVTSLAKFYPQEVGAELWCKSPALAKQLKETVTAQQVSVARWTFGRVSRRIRRRLSGVKHNPSPAHRRYFDEAELRRPALLCGRSNTDSSNEMPEEPPHRSHYQKLLEITACSPFGQPLYPQLPSEVVPYVFPFLLHSPDTFHVIRQTGIPLYRWEEMVPTDCQVSHNYRDRLIQIPCHQDMQPADFALISRTLTEKITPAPSGSIVA